MKYSENYIEFIKDLADVLERYEASIKAEVVPNEKYCTGRELRLYLKLDDGDFTYGSTAGDEYSFNADELNDLAEALKTHIMP